MTIAFIPIDGILRFIAANPGYLVVSDLGHHTRWSVMVAK